MLFAGWMLFITLLSLYSFPGLEDEIEIPYLDKAIHFGFYAVASYLGCLFLREQSRRKMSISKTIIWMVFSMIIYGIIIEVIQWKYTTWRSGDTADALANALGAMAGAAAIKFLYSGNWQLKWKN